MAGDWIKVERAALTKPEVLEMADALKIDRHAVLGKLLEVWFWFDEQTQNGNADGVSPVTLARFIDERTGVTGFGAEMQKRHWLDGSSMPNFDRHNGESAKNRALTNKRVKRFRNEKNVTSALPEKRREEKNLKPSTSLRSVAVTEGGEVVTPTNPTASQDSNRAAWAAFALAYETRYGTAPVRNGKTNAQVAQLVKRLGREAPHVAAFYVGHNDARYVREGHTLGMLLAHAEKLATEYRTGRTTTLTQAGQADKLQATGSTFTKLIAEARSHEPENP